MVLRLPKRIKGTDTPQTSKNLRGSFVSKHGGIEKSFNNNGYLYSRVTRRLRADTRDYGEVRVEAERPGNDRGRSVDADRQCGQDMSRSPQVMRNDAILPPTLSSDRTLNADFFYREQAESATPTACLYQPPHTSVAVTPPAKTPA